MYVSREISNGHNSHEHFITNLRVWEILQDSASSPAASRKQPCNLYTHARIYNVFVQKPKHSRTEKYGSGKNEERVFVENNADRPFFLIG